MSSPIIKFYLPQDLEKFAEIFIEKFHKPKDSLPVEIDVIAQRDLGIDIFPFSGLALKFGLHGYLALSLKTIYIEQYIMDDDAFERRYRFTVAEEIAHSLLHKDLFLGVETPEDYIKALDKIDGFQHTRMDLDAKRLAEAILMPAERFRKEALEIATNYSQKGKKGLIKLPLFNKLSEIFNVSQEVVRYRFMHLGLSSQIVL